MTDININDEGFEFTVSNCNPNSHFIRKENVRFVIFSIQIYKIGFWTYYEWFYSEITLKILFDWIEDTEPKLKKLDYKLILCLNDGTTKEIARTDKVKLRNIVAFHIAEINCVLRHSK